MKTTACPITTNTCTARFEKGKLYISSNTGTIVLCSCTTNDRLQGSTVHSGGAGCSDLGTHSSSFGAGFEWSTYHGKVIIDTEDC